MVMIRIAWVGMAGVLALAAGCGGVDGRAGAAPVATVDIGAVAPCELLTSAQLGEVGLAGAAARPIETGPVRSCQWTAPGSFVPSVLAISSGAGLSALAAGQSEAGASLVEGAIAGRPALEMAVGGACSILVEIADSTVLNVLGSGGCGAARRMAELAVTNLGV
jgi:hypothetical protein